MQFDIYGDGDAEYVAHLHATYGDCPHIHFRGKVAGHELAEIYPHYDVLIFPSEQEPFALTPLKRQLLASCIIGTTTGGSGEFLCHEKTALTYTAGDASELYDRILYIASRESLRQNLALNAQRMVQQKVHPPAHGATHRRGTGKRRARSAAHQPQMARTLLQHLQSHKLARSPIMTAPLRIAAIIPGLPEPADRGTFKRYRAMIRALAQLGEVDCVCLVDELITTEQQTAFAQRVHRLHVAPITLQTMEITGKTMLGHLGPERAPLV